MAKSVRAPSRDAVSVRTSRPCPVVQRSLVVSLRFVASPMAHGRRVWNGRDVHAGRPTPASRQPNPYRVHATGGADVPASPFTGTELGWNPFFGSRACSLPTPWSRVSLIPLHPALAERAESAARWGPPSTRRGGCPDDLRSVAARGFVGLPVGAKDGAYQVLSSGTVGFMDSRIRDERRAVRGSTRCSQWCADRARRCRPHRLRSRRPELCHCGVRATSRPQQPAQELGLRTARVVRTVCNNDFHSCREG